MHDLLLLDQAPVCLDELAEEVVATARRQDADHQVFTHSARGLTFTVLTPPAAGAHVAKPPAQAVAAWAGHTKSG